MTSNVEPENIELLKFKLEKQRYESSRSLDMERLRWERSSKVWSTFLAVIPLIGLVAGYIINSSLEREKNFRIHSFESLSARRQFIDRQLSMFYYPIKFRLEKDTAVWTLADQLTNGVRSKNREFRTEYINQIRSAEFSRSIENKVLIPNHEEILNIVKWNLDLLKNPDELSNIQPLVDAISSYQRHVAVYKALRENGIYSVNPAYTCVDCEFPLVFPHLINRRIGELERQRSAVSQAIAKIR